MSGDLYETIRRIVQQELKTQRGAELAIVQEQHPHADDGDTDNYSCSVALRDSNIVLKRVPICCGRKGQASVPDVGDLVLVQFIAGDVNAPIIIGSLYNDEDRPPANASGEWMLRLPAAESDENAVTVRLNSEGKKSIVVNVADACKVSIVDDDPVVKIEVGGGSKIEIARNGDIAMNGGSQLAVKSGGDMTIEAGGQLNLKGSVINLN